ncbi:MAG: metallophosphoesterase [Ignavibacteria bacterium]|jgi:3',5'-cyclic AMP phosphodiesterase CpdA|nr:metallophosphoesterase [Ignavibacteria bacterium]MCU7504938.1 metallophosphoesterase [Ignavibacteria bacterium]MCU7518403.1 metallophosphoesterase [Ignavibacteria bacterium]
MRLLAHISDLHFGRENQKIVYALREDLIGRAPDVVVVSGDFTQRARVSQYLKARRFLDSLPFRIIAIPGNHDIPLFDLFRRIFFPLQRYKKYISQDLNPLYADDEIVICALNTARSFAWKEGRISVEQISYLGNKLCSYPEDRFKIVVTHHPFIPPPDNPAIKLVGRSGLALDAIDQCKADLLLAGHLHLDYSGDVRGFYLKRKRSVISVQAGTAVSVRTRNEPNAYNLIKIIQNRIDIQVRIWNGSAFLDELLTSYEKRGDEWVHLA